ncbi:MAG: DUF2797 domain-containing protein [Pseudomonadales bacterium]|nr:DUF2797 domain-containing protein [Pseudomonadales bacterium]
MRGFLKKMTTKLADPVNYYLPLGEDEFHLNPYIGQPIQLIYHNQIQCQHCGRAAKKSFSQGYCYPCFKKLAQCDLCIMSPERCHFDQGTCREPEWAKGFCFQDHIVYLANSSGVKVGITRPSQIPTRWIDQGAVQGLPIFSVSTRQISGLVEVIFKKHISDKTHWQRMLKSANEEVDLVALRETLLDKVSDEIIALQNRFGLQAIQPITHLDTQSISYPVNTYPTKVTSKNFDKMPVIEGTLMGIKAQYLIFDTGVINIRKFTGYDVELLV